MTNPLSRSHDGILTPLSYICPAFTISADDFDSVFSINTPEYFEMRAFAFILGIVAVQGFPANGTLSGDDLKLMEKLLLYGQYTGVTDEELISIWNRPQKNINGKIEGIQGDISGAL